MSAIIPTAITTIAKILSDAFDKSSTIAGYYGSSSLSEATKLLRVEPLTIVSRDLQQVDYMPDVMNTVLSIFSGYYLAGINILTKVNDVRVAKILDRLNPDRDFDTFALTVESTHTPTMSVENFKYRLPKPGEKTPSMEDSKTLNEASNLAVGKVLNVEIAYHDDSDNSDKTVKLPISVRLASNLVPSVSISNILTSSTEDTSLVERFHAWRSGRIAFWRDLIWCQDLMDEHKRAVISDDTGSLAEIMRRVNNSKKYGVLSKNPSLATASNIFVITESNAKDIELKIGGSLKKMSFRDKIFKDRYVMILAIVDRNFERVTFYTRGIEAGTDVSIREIKSANKGSGVDIADIMRGLSSGMPVSF